MARRRRKKKGEPAPRGSMSTSLRSGEQRCISRKGDIWTKVVRSNGEGADPDAVAQVKVSIQGPTGCPPQPTDGHGRTEFDRLDPGAYEVRAALSGGLRKYFIGDPQPTVSRCDLVAGATEYFEFVLEPHWIKLAFQQEGTEAPIPGVTLRAEFADGPLEESGGPGGEVELRNMREGDAAVVEASVEGETWIFVGIE